MTKSSVPWGLYVGNPARRIKERIKELLAYEHLYLSEKANSKF